MQEYESFNTTTSGHHHKPGNFSSVVDNNDIGRGGTSAARDEGGIGDGRESFDSLLPEGEGGQLQQGCTI